MLSGSPYHGAANPRRLEYPPICAGRLSPAPYAAGMGTIPPDRTAVKVYSREKTLADCFKHRNDVGLDTVLEAVRMYKAQRCIDAGCDPAVRDHLPCSPNRTAIPRGSTVIRAPLLLFVNDSLTGIGKFSGRFRNCLRIMRWSGSSIDLASRHTSTGWSSTPHRCSRFGVPGRPGPRKTSTCCRHREFC